MVVQGVRSLIEMARYAPLRTAIFSVGPVVWVLIQVVNAYIHGGAITLVIAFAIVMTAFSFLVTRYHVASFRRTRLSRRFEGCR